MAGYTGCIYPDFESKYTSWQKMLKVCLKVTSQTKPCCHPRSSDTEIPKSSGIFFSRTSNANLTPRKAPQLFKSPKFPTKWELSAHQLLASAQELASRPKRDRIQWVNPAEAIKHPCQGGCYLQIHAAVNHSHGTGSIRLRRCLLSLQTNKWIPNTKQAANSALLQA